MSLSYSHPIKRALRKVARIKPCGCGCNTIYVRGHARQWGDAGRFAKWLTWDPDGD